MKLWFTDGWLLNVFYLLKEYNNKCENVNVKWIKIKNKHKWILRKIYKKDKNRFNTCFFNFECNTVFLLFAGTNTGSEKNTFYISSILALAILIPTILLL